MSETPQTTLREALRMARQWICNDAAPIGWSIDRIDEVLAVSPETGWRDKLADIIERMRNEGPRYKSHELGYTDSVSANNVDEWADELAELLEGR